MSIISNYRIKPQGENSSAYKSWDILVCSKQLRENFKRKWLLKEPGDYNRPFCVTKKKTEAGWFTFLDKEVYIA
jgi:hypothetical protein